MKKATAVAPANIAFIKYWGKRDNQERLPLNDSFSMNLDGALTTTTVEFIENLQEDSVELVGGEFSDKEKQRIIRHMDRIREKAGTSMKAKIVTKNSFPKGAGSASSASGFAALTVAACGAWGLALSEKELTVLAREGSGSACRSIPNGFVWWHAASQSQESYAESLCPAQYWDLRDILVIVDDSMKQVATTDAMDQVKTSPFWEQRVEGITEKMKALFTALKEKNFPLLGEIIEEDCLNMHAVMMTQEPSVLYWNSHTMALMDAVYAWRKEGVPVYFTIDAGPNVHLIVEAGNVDDVIHKVKHLDPNFSIIHNTPHKGTTIIGEHLF